MNIVYTIYQKAFNGYKDTTTLIDIIATTHDKNCAQT